MRVDGSSSDNWREEDTCDGTRYGENLLEAMTHLGEINSGWFRRVMNWFLIFLDERKSSSKQFGRKRVRAVLLNHLQKRINGLEECDDPRIETNLSALKWFVQF